MLRSAASILLLFLAVGCGGGGGGGAAALPPGVSPASADASLITLELSSGRLSPAFDPTVFAYTVGPELLPASIFITPTATDPAATITVNAAPVASGAVSNAVPLSIGVIEIVTVDVTAADGVTHSSYVIAITRDGVAGEVGFIKASNTETDDEFGHEIAMSGNTLVVTSRFESSAAAGVNGDDADNSAQWTGAAYVYVYENGAWVFQAYLKASNPDPYDRFGTSVDIDGDTLVVGAPFEGSAATGIGGLEGDNTSSSSGAVYVFTRTAGIWSQEAYIKASNAEASDQFGGAVTISGDTLAVGAKYEKSAATGVNGDEADNTLFESGAAYVFIRTGTTWTQEAYLKASNAGFEDFFGSRLALDANTLAVAASGEASNAMGVGGDESDDSAATSGAVYVFVRAGSTWSQQAYVKATNTESGDRFGGALDIKNNTLAVGATGEDSSAASGGDQLDNFAEGAGAVYLYARVGTTWIPEAYLKHPSPKSNDSFGSSVALERGMLLVGVPGDWTAGTGIDNDVTDNGVNETGSAFLFGRDGVTWTVQSFLMSSNGYRGDRLGSSVAIGAAGGVLAAGTIIEGSDLTGADPVDPVNDFAPNSGAVYLFR